MEYDFSGWATRANVKCSDGRVIMPNAFKHNDGNKVPLVWNHRHNDPLNVLGHAYLENRDEGVYAYCKFNETEAGKNAKIQVEHGDITALSIYANRLKQRGSDVLHGEIREVSLVLAGANPSAYIDSVIRHGEDCDDEEAIIYSGENIALFHADAQNENEEDSNVENEETLETVYNAMTPEQQECVHAMIGLALENSDETEEVEETEEAETEDIHHADEDNEDDDDDETLQDIFEKMTEKQQMVVYAMIGMAMEEKENSKEENNMKHNVFNQDEVTNDGVLSHADQENIITMAKQTGVGSLQTAMEIYASENQHLAHNFVDTDGKDAIDWLFPEYKDLNTGAPETLTRDYTWINSVMNGVHKSPITRIRTRYADARDADLRALGYKKGDKKELMGNIKLAKRTTDPQTVYIKDAMHRDDIIDITDFDVVAYRWRIMRELLDEELALAIMLGDGREEGDEHKIDDTKIRPIWLDDDLYTIHYDVDIAAAKAELQGTDTSVYYGDNYVYAEAIISAALYSREKYKGSGNLDFYCTPHLLNVMLLARDRNGHRMYSSKADLVAALNVRNIHTVEQFEGKTRTDKNGKEKKLLGLFVNLSDYHLGCAKGGQVAKFSQFDIDFNQEKYLLETRLSGALTRLWSAIALEESVTPAAQG